MVQAPLPTTMPASVASYCASSRACAETPCGARSRNAAAAKSAGLQSTDRAEIVIVVVTERRSLASALSKMELKQQSPANNAQFPIKTGGIIIHAPDGR